jgi:hypothetical protein
MIVQNDRVRGTLGRKKVKRLKFPAVESLPDACAWTFERGKGAADPYTRQITGNGVAVVSGK